MTMSTAATPLSSSAQPTSCIWPQAVLPPPGLPSKTPIGEAAIAGSAAPPSSRTIAARTNLLRIGVSSSACVVAAKKTSPLRSLRLLQR